MTVPDTYKKKYSSFSAKIILGCLLACFFLLLNGSITCKAETKTYTNKSTGYQVIVEDDANLLTDEEETTLGKEMAPITTYGSVAFNPSITILTILLRIIPEAITATPSVPPVQPYFSLIWTIGTSGFTATESFMKPLRKVMPTLSPIMYTNMPLMVIITPVHLPLLVRLIHCSKGEKLRSR